MKCSLAAAALAAVTASSALADEVWTDPFGDRLIYSSETGTIAVFQAPHGEWIYVEALAGNYSDRTGTFTGYWMIPEGDADEEMFSCASQRSFPGSGPTHYWGPIEIDFDQPGFPTALTLRRGFCDDLTGEYAGELTGTWNDTRYHPIVGQ
ncbi:hypothetical protein V0U79_10330 [Hyphobacterium sp. HN65]|uniref:Secreted protein n=1 Tax=Hyphobacterium lacteum TaxID=3116575 RepID=A0ABU7LS71_9PROT|nr:hypothetical protein [Hyphobacterium sp. HN65]MEE2526767.1 hypothetical protein [Hyphobacterium sp. HN65]